MLDADALLQRRHQDAHEGARHRRGGRLCAYASRNVFQPIEVVCADCTLCSRVWRIRTAGKTSFFNMLFSRLSHLSATHAHVSLGYTRTHVSRLHAHTCLSTTRAHVSRLYVSRLHAHTHVSQRMAARLSAVRLSITATSLSRSHLRAAISRAAISRSCSRILLPLAGC